MDDDIYKKNAGETLDPMLFSKKKMDVDRGEPFSLLYPALIGAVYGLLVRGVFGKFDAMFSVMAVSFAVMAPFAVGAVTVYMAEKIGRQSYKYYIFAPWMATAVMLGGCALLLLEGSICIAMALPLFLGISSIGGLVMGAICRALDKPHRGLQCVALLPLIFAVAERQHTPPDAVQQIISSIHINAPAASVWQHINFPTNIAPAELGSGLVYKIGVPYPVEARTLSEGVGGKRRLQWQRGIVFEENITAWQPNRHIAWNYIFDAKSFPPGSMDEHVELGGKYFDLQHTSYTLTPENGGTRLDVVVDFRVSTAFNWYAVPMAEFLISDTAQAILRFYKNRSEGKVQQRNSS